MAFAGILHGINDIRYQEHTPRAITGEEVQVAVKCAAICGSDIPRVKSKGTYKFPTIPGHEISGIVVEKGENIKSINAGDRVTVYPLMPCGICPPCQSHCPNLCENYNYLGSRCDGGFAEYVVCPAKNVIKIAPTVSFEAAALVEPMAVALRGIKKSNISSGDKVVVLGLGSVGLFAVQWAKIFGASVVIGVDRNPHKLKIAAAVGANYTINSLDYNYNAEFQKIFGAQGADVVIECSGANSFQELAITIVKKGGTISLIGNPQGDVTVKEKIFQQIVRKEITLKGSWNSVILPEEDEWGLVLDYLSAGRIDPVSIITHYFNLSDIKRVFDDLYERKIAGYCKGVFVINKHLDPATLNQVIL
ncbi:galactitol-1-phosphate 5-dehydrogenase [Candidatus Woesearchaeota archaeon]|nr:galactitol-1-phosphate 5-dehydrogenase [Candidatus Woesearchaeota archaeon]